MVRKWKWSLLTVEGLRRAWTRAKRAAPFGSRRAAAPAAPAALAAEAAPVGHLERNEESTTCS